MIKKVIEQLDSENYKDLHQELSANRGEKFSKLLELYRETELEDAAVREKIGINSAAFYALKSRLTDKLQEFLFSKAVDNREDLLKNVFSIPFLVHNTPRETAILLLEQLEVELKKVDMPRELINVYKGLKKLHSQSDRFFHFQQLYNKTVAYALSLDKADELQSSFNRELGEYMLSGDAQKKDILALYLKELKNLSKLYDSHRINALFYLAAISYSLFVDGEDNIPETEKTTEELLEMLHEILTKNPDDQHYKFFLPIYHFLNFEYYQKLNLHKNGITSFEHINQNKKRFLLSGHTCLAPKFLLSSLEFAVRNKSTAALGASYLADGIVPNPENSIEHAYYSLYASGCNYYSGKYAEGSAILNNCLNTISFKNYPAAEFQVKLFQTLLLLLAKKTESAEVTFRSVSRKLQSEQYSTLFPIAFAFSKFLKIAINDKSSTKLKKLKDAYSPYLLLSASSQAFLRFLVVSDEQMLALSKQ